MRRQERINLHRKQEAMKLKKGAPLARDLINGVPTLRATKEGIVEYVKYNGTMYKNKYELSTKVLDDSLIKTAGNFDLNSGGDINLTAANDLNITTKTHFGTVDVSAQTFTITNTISTKTVNHPTLKLMRNVDVEDTGVHGTYGDIGQITFSGLNSNGDAHDYCLIQGKIDDDAAGSEDGSLILSVYDGGSLNPILYIENDRVGINASTPSYMLDVGGGDSGDNVRCYDIYTHDGGAHSSDERMKENIVDSALGLNFINTLKPRSYKWKDTPEFERDGDTIPAHTYTRTHYGLISHEVKETMDSLSISDVDFAGYIYNEIDEQYQLRYNEFISPVIKAIQELSTKIDAMQIEINDLK